MTEERYLHKNARKFDMNGVVIWRCSSCYTSKACCIHSSLKIKDYSYKCPNYLGVDEEGLLCKMPNSIDFILSED